MPPEKYFFSLMKDFGNNAALICIKANFNSD